MRKILKWVGIVAAALVVLIVITGGVIYRMAGAKINTTYNVALDHIPIPADSASLARGAHLADAFGCIECHGADMAGLHLIDDAALGQVYSANLTKGEGGIGGAYTSDEMIRSIREGVRDDGKSVWLMPSHDYHELNDADVAVIVAFVRTKPPVNKTHPANSLGPIGRFLLATGQLPLLTAPLIDRSQPRPAAVPIGVTVEYGRYLARLCQGCHRADYTGGVYQGAGSPPSRNLTPAGNLGHWSREDFITALRTGQTPEHYQLDPNFMPWKSVGHATDDELTAIYRYLKTLPAKETVEK